MKLTSNSFQDGGVMPAECCFAVIDPKTHVKLSHNRNPHLAWSEAPVGTKSYAIVCHDPDVPSKGDHVNVEGQTVPASLARVDFFHWLAFDIPASVTSIASASASKAVTARGKGGPRTEIGGHEVRHGINDYTGWFASDRDMAGDYYGYDGPCPPWNDEIVHRYVFTVFALDCEHLSIEAPARGTQLRAAMQGHVLGQASVFARYSLNPNLAL